MSLALDDDAASHGVEAWEAAAAGVLRKAHRLADDAPDHDVWSTLARTTLDGIDVTPLGTSALVADLPQPVRPTRAGAWDIRARAGDGQQAQAELTGGATSLWLQGPPETVLADVLLDIAPVVLADPSAATELLAMGELHPHTNLGHPAEEADEAQADRARGAGVLGFVADASAAHRDGASDAQELAWGCWLGAAYLRRVGDPALLEFRYAATDDQFATIAKLRAARVLWARMLELSSIADVAQRQHAVTSTMMTSRYDRHVNLLRTTVAGFAAGVGGADSVTVLPFENSTLGRRMARNVSHLLIEESHLAVVADAAGGSFLVERLTHDLAEAAWAELARIEQDGTDAFDARVAATAAERAGRVARRSQPITGLSEFPSADEGALSGEPAGYGAAFEALRDRPVEQPVFLATMGPLASHTARAGFATNLLAAGGLTVVSAGPTDGVEDVLAAYDGQAVVMLAGADPTYAAWGAELVGALREAGAQWVVVAGKPGLPNGQSLGVDDAARVGTDAVAFLTTVREKLS
ncbi:methylmalonyl-CoA mutase [Nocardioides mangrovicus]|uniref:Methylmalonyl-CoA mutase n=1 Tax=Nocardioides mangrovicus TaxID=2478913 RepID=A0A3L8P3N5_9ACTN|nr:methylmalonyl-CoA mutase family protein [Nocardioides mangrovicus]RLV50000.1 methylmalonyl-CoA mutase [Nocardioides mangrovicus]